MVAFVAAVAVAVSVLGLFVTVFNNGCHVGMGFFGDDAVTGTWYFGQSCETIYAPAVELAFWAIITGIIWVPALTIVGIAGIVLWVRGARQERKATPTT